MNHRRPPKGHYTEMEAAAAVGVSVEELRSLVRNHVLSSEDDMANVPKTWFQPSDLLLLRLLATSRERATVPG